MKQSAEELQRGRSAAAGGDAQPTHRSLERGLAVLEALSAARGRATLADTARRLGLHRSTAHHLMQTLVALGYLRQEGATRVYELTPKLHELSGRRWSAGQLGELGQPILAELSRATGEATSLAAWIDGAVTIAAKHESCGPVRVVQDVGSSRPIHCTAVGKALAAWLPPDAVKAALGRARMRKLTPKTIVTRAAFDAELEQIRRAGHALDDEEHFLGIRCIAMPVFCHTGEVVASMCVLGPSQRMTDRKMRQVRPRLAAASRKLSERLGYAPGVGATPRHPVARSAPRE